MRIPGADEVFGWRQLKVIPKSPLPEADTGIAQGLGNLAGSIGDIAQREQQKEELEKRKIEHAREIEQNKLEQKIEQAERERQHAEFQTKVITYRSKVYDIAQGVMDNADIPEPEKFADFQQKADQLKAETLKDIPQDAVAKWDPVHADAMFEAKKQFAGYVEKKANDQAIANGLTTYETLIQQAAKSPGDRTKAIQLFDQISWHGFSEAKQAEMKQNLIDKTAENEIIKRINAGDLRGVLKDLRSKSEAGDHPYLSDMDVKTREHYISAIENDIKQAERQRIAEAKAAAAARKDSLRDVLDEYEHRKLAGMPINPADEVSIAKAVREFPALAKKFTRVKEQGESFAYRSEQFAKDPLTFGAGALGYDIKPLNMADPNVLAQQLQARITIGQKIKADNNMSYAPVLTAKEAEGLAGMLGTQKDGGVQLIGNLQKIVGPLGVAGIAQQVKNTDSQAGMVIGLTAANKTNTAAMISTGAKYLKEKAVKLPKEAEMRGLFDGMIGDAMLGLPQNQEAHYKAFQSYYAALAGKEGDTLGESIDKKKAETAMKEIVGDVARINGKKVVLPDGYSEDRFLNSIKKIDSSFVNQLSGGGVQGIDSKAAAELIRDDGRWHVTTRPNIYRVEVNGSYLMTKGGNYVEVLFK